MIALEIIRQKAFELGWDDVAVTKAQIDPLHIESYKQWIANQLHADLTYMENQLRTDPSQLLPGAKTAIIFATNYKQEKTPLIPGKGLIASYARGRDYHHVHRKRLKKFINWLEDFSGQKDIAKGFSDSTPIMEKALAIQSGLGWMGKNSLIIHKKFGTYFLLSGCLTTLDIEHVVKPTLPKCGSCERCIKACPTQALIKPYTLDCKRCLSYHTIESKNPIPKDIQAKNPGYAFGCDICQEACPHNVRSPTHQSKDFDPASGIGSYLDLEQLNNLPDEKLFGTPLQRRKKPGLNHTLSTLPILKD